MHCTTAQPSRLTNNYLFVIITTDALVSAKYLLYKIVPTICYKSVKNFMEAPSRYSHNAAATAMHYCAIYQTVEKKCNSL